MAYTLAELRTEVYEQSGEIDDLSPTSGDTTRLDQMINEGQRRVAAYKTPRGRRTRFQQLKGQLNFQTSIVEGDVVAGTSSTVTLDSSAGAEDNRYNDWLVRVNGEVHLIASYASSRVATIVDTWGTTPDSDDTYTLYKRFERILPANHSWVSEHIALPSESTLRDMHEGNFLEVMKIIDLSRPYELDHAVRGEAYANEVEATGDPSEWYRFGNMVKFDRALDEVRWFRMEYYRAPTDMSADGDLPEIPEEFHWGIVLWCRYWSMVRQQDAPMARTAMREFTDFMTSTISAFEAAAERDAGPVIRVKPGTLRMRR